MAYRVTVLYGQPKDPQAFDAHFSTIHVPLAARIPDVKQVMAGRIESIDGSAPENYLQAQLIFATKDEALQALSSPQGQAASADMSNFATGGASLFLSNDEVEIPENSRVTNP